MTYQCSDVERIVWSDGPDAAPQDHIAECESCRSQSRQAADLQAALFGLRTRLAPTPADLEPAIFAAISSRTTLDRARDVVSHPRFWRGAAVGAAAAATAAVGLIVAKRRFTPRLPETELVAEAS